MHPGLAAFAGEGAEAAATSGMLRTLMAGFVTRAKTIFASRESAKVMLGKLAITGRAFFSPTAFSKPADRTECVKRLRTNMGYFRNIYVLIFLAVLVYTVLSSPLLLFGLSALAGAWIYSFIITNQEEALIIAGFEMRRREKLIVLIPFSIIVVTLCGMINSLMYVIFLTSLIIGPHASFHEAAEMDALDALELEGLQSGIASPGLPI